MATSSTVFTSNCSDINLSAVPYITLMDEIVTIEVDGLQPKEAITLRTYFNDEGKQFESHAHYTSDEKGKVNTTTQPSQGGLYKGMFFIQVYLIIAAVACLHVKGTDHDFCWSRKPIYHLQKQGNIHIFQKKISKSPQICWNNEEKQGFWQVSFLRAL